jgi:hypothetical protein
MSDKYLPNIGHIAGDDAQRDAIHIAVAPVVAGERLYPGQHVAFEAGSAERVRPFGTTIGIVDPFHEGPILPEQRFWMFLYPNTITSLRHEWTHPAFAPEPPSSRDASEAWLRDFCDRSDCPGYEAVIAKAIDNSDAWDSAYLHFNGSDAHGEIPPEFWDHVEVVTGRSIPRGERAEFFSCSC